MPKVPLPIVHPFSRPSIICTPATAVTSPSFITLSGVSAPNSFARFLKKGTQTRLKSSRETRGKQSFQTQSFLIGTPAEAPPTESTRGMVFACTTGTTS